MPRSSRAAKGGPLTAQQAAPRNPGKGSEEGQARASGAVLKTSVCKVQAARAAGEHSLGAGSQSRMWVGSEDLASRRRPPAGPPGHREGIAEALSRGPRGQDSGDEVPPPPPGQGGHGTKPGQDMAERMLLERAGTHGKRPLGHKQPRVGAGACPHPGGRSVSSGASWPSLSCPPTSWACVSCPLVVQREYSQWRPGPTGPGGSQHGWGDNGMML